ncbi:hypothetical protein PA25_24880 [Pseudoalteromonas sp. A25]|uniref:DUF1330 domain-containing protein n=1 Tax=Pseudoalteromonas sp. A25 TaxID=116092 RepID=UPI001260B547|nr:DUF1330 domain-containing protein [Pseudoalteromonas sp. A25]BBN82503.1 hypothetical protein PA25_24880 [Pseudoalteromonas sp. A25]
MRFEMLVALQVSDQAQYSRYRAAMAPILNDKGGFFSADFEVSQVLSAQIDQQINRVFTINFENEQVADEFFNDARYLNAKSQFFESSVSNTLILRRYYVE